MKTIETLIAEIKENEALQKGLAEALQNNSLAAFLAEQGCDASAEEFVAAVKAQSAQLSDEELAAVAAGNDVPLEIRVTTYVVMSIIKGFLFCTIDDHP